MTPSRSRRSSRAVTVPRAIRSRREASRAPIRGSAVYSSISLTSRSSINRLLTVQTAQRVGEVLHTMFGPVRLAGMTTTSHRALTAEELKADLTLEQLQQL